MRSPVPHAPGWYPDGSDPDHVHYFDGDRWTGRRRPRPVWAPDSTVLIRLEPKRPKRRSRGWAPPLVVGAVVVLLAALMTLGDRTGLGSIAGPSYVGTAGSDYVPVVQDGSWVTAANQVCEGFLAPVAGGGASAATSTAAGHTASSTAAGHTASSTAAGGSTGARTDLEVLSSLGAGGTAFEPQARGGTSGTPPSSASVRELVLDLEGLGFGLESLPVGRADVSVVDAWVAAWFAMAHLVNGDAGDPAAWSAADRTSLQSEAGEISAFAKVNGLNACAP